MKPDTDIIISDMTTHITVKGIPKKYEKQIRAMGGKREQDAWILPIIKKSDIEYLAISVI